MSGVGSDFSLDDSGDAYARGDGDAILRSFVAEMITRMEESSHDPALAYDIRFFDDEGFFKLLDRCEPKGSALGSQLREAMRRYQAGNP